MYGQSDVLAYILSIVTHFIQVFGRLILFFFWALFWILILFLWIIAPLYSLWELAV